MTKVEKRAALVFLCLAILLVTVKSYRWYIDSTKLVPAVGGKYTEAVAGGVKYINPILVQNDAEKSVSRLIFSSLVKFDGDKIIPDAAQSWQITDNGSTLTFNLRHDITFSNGDNLTANDVAYTIQNIQNADLKSPLNSAWSNVTVSVDSDYQITFQLAKPYGPFIYSCNFGILPKGVASDVFDKKFIGSGPYQFDKAKSKDGRINEISLVRNPLYYGNQPDIQNLDFTFFENASDAQSAFENGKYSALSGAISSAGKNYSFPTTKRLGLILNTRRDKLKDVSVRQKIVQAQKLDQPLSLTLTIPDSPLQKAKAEEIKGNLSGNNITLTINVLSPVDFQDAVDKHNYELLLYGFDFGYDRDPYVFWHSSQLDKLNLAGWSDKQTDILLEDARMIVDPVARNQKYDDFYNQISSQYLVYFYDPISFNYIVKDGAVKNFVPITGNEASSRYNYISDWYIKEKRIRK